MRKILQLQNLFMKELLNKKVILWDFDGVILNSSEIREEGFVQVLSNYPTEKVELLLKYHNENGGLSRYDKFEYFFKNILKIELNHEILNRLAFEFSVIMKKNLVDKKLLIEEVNNFIIKEKGNYGMHIVSGSDENELKYLCAKLGISNNFNSIHGSPTPKNLLVKNLIERVNYQKSKICLIGDSINDLNAAIANDIDFYGYNSPYLREMGCNYINNF